MQHSKHHTLRWGLLTGTLILLIPVLLAAGPTASAQSTTPDPTYYGINFVAPYEPWLSIAHQSGARVVRWQFNWRDHEPSPGQWTWEASAGPIAAWNNAGIAVNAILHYPPDWAIANPGPHGTAPWIFDALMPRGLTAGWNSGENGFAQYCYRFAQQYRGQISSYEIWNEPDIDNFWDGSAADYFYMMKTCYLGIRAADPDTPVAMASMVLLIEQDFFPTVVRMAAEDPAGPANNYFFDMANIHMYGDPDLAYDLTVQTREVLDQYGMMDKPIWITETNVALRGLNNAPSQPQWGYATEEEAGWFVWQVASSAQAAGAERLMFFRLADDGMDQAFGLVHGDGTPRPAYESIQVAAEFLRDIVSAEREIRNGVTINTLYRTDGARIIVLYSKVGEPVQIEVEARTSAAGLFNPVGGYATIQPTARGTYAVTLLPARGRDQNQLDQYSVGGPPLMIVEFDEVPPVAALTVNRSGTEALLNWRGSDGEHGTGIAGFDVEVQRDDGPWEPWLTNVPDTSATYDLSAGGTFSFRVRAVDAAGNTGEFSLPGETRLAAGLTASVLDLRGQPVAGAVLRFADGASATADGNGMIRIERQAGEYGIEVVDGGAHGEAYPGPVVLSYDQTTTATWTVLPTENLIPNGDFNTGSLGWTWNAAPDVSIITLNDDAMLSISGHRRPWGAPSASVTVTIPAEVADPLLMFNYRMPDAGQTLRLRVIDGASQRTLWAQNSEALSFAGVHLEMGAYRGRTITLVFDLWGPKNAIATEAVIDRVQLVDVPRD